MWTDQGRWALCRGRCCSMRSWAPLERVGLLPQLGVLFSVGSVFYGAHAVEVAVLQKPLLRLLELRDCLGGTRYSGKLAQECWRRSWPKMAAARFYCHHLVAAHGGLVVKFLPTSFISPFLQFKLRLCWNGSNCSCLHTDKEQFLGRILLSISSVEILP